MDTLTSAGNLAPLLKAQGNKLADRGRAAVPGGAAGAAGDARRPAPRHTDQREQRHALTLTSAHNLAQLLQDQGKLVKAEPSLYKCRETLRVSRETSLGDRHTITLTSASNLAMLLRGQGKLAEAEPLMQETLRVERETLGDRHASTLTTGGVSLPSADGNQLC